MYTQSAGKRISYALDVASYATTGFVVLELGMPQPVIGAGPYRELTSCWGGELTVSTLTLSHHSCTHLDLLWCPRVQVDRLHSGYVDP